MSAQQSPAAMDGRTSLTSAPSHAVIPNPDGTLTMWSAGRFGPVPRSTAVMTLACLSGSPSPASQARAAAIRAALLETMQ